MEVKTLVQFMIIIHFVSGLEECYNELCLDSEYCDEGGTKRCAPCIDACDHKNVFCEEHCPNFAVPEDTTTQNSTLPAKTTQPVPVTSTGNDVINNRVRPDIGFEAGVISAYIIMALLLAGAGIALAGCLRMYFPRRFSRIVRRLRCWSASEPTSDTAMTSESQSDVTDDLMEGSKDSPV